MTDQKNQAWRRKLPSRNAKCLPACKNKLRNSRMASVRDQMPARKGSESHCSGICAEVISKKRPNASKVSGQTEANRAGGNPVSKTPLPTSDAEAAALPGTSRLSDGSQVSFGGGVACQSVRMIHVRAMSRQHEFVILRQIRGA